MIDQLRMVNHEVHLFSSFANLREQMDALDVDGLCELAQRAARLSDELTVLVNEAESRTRRLSMHWVACCVTRLLAWKHRALTRYYAPLAPGGKRLRAEYEDFIRTPCEVAA